MAISYRGILPETARRLRLLMADVDGSLNTGGDLVSPTVSDAIKGLKGSGMIIGIVSGRTDSRIRAMALNLGLDGPLIAENGAVARIDYRSELLDLGYSRQPALAALERLKAAFPGKIRERQDNAERLIDLVFWADGIGIDEVISRAGDDVQVLDSTYILHLMQKNIDKGQTVHRLLGLMGSCNIMPDEVLVVGDSMTDLSLFQRFREGVLISNPNIPGPDRQTLLEAAHYITDHEDGDGFAELARHIIEARA